MGRKGSTTFDGPSQSEQRIAASELAESSLWETVEGFRNTIEDAPCGYYRLTRDGIIQYVNREWERMNGVSRKEVVGKFIHLAYPPEAGQLMRENIRKVLAGATVSGDFRRITGDGRKHYASYSIKPFYSNGKVVAIEGRTSPK